MAIINKNILLLLAVLIIISCKEQSLKNVSNKTEILTLLKDSLKVFKNVKELNIEGVLKGEKINIQYHSISEKEFYTAIEKNKNKIRYFNRKNKINEYRIEAKLYRKDSLLILSG